MVSTPTVFVSSATGAQGSNLARQLRELGWGVHATTRNLESPTAVALAKLGVKLTLGDWDNKPALEQAIAGCSMLFLNTVPKFCEGVEHEREQAAGILAIARAAGVRHVVFSSGLAVDQLHNLSVFDPKSFLGQTLLNKAAIEKSVQDAGLERWTILRGASFMENFVTPKVRLSYGALATTGVWNMAFLPSTKLPYTATADIARFAVAAFQDPARFHAQSIALAGDELASEEVMAQLSEVVGKDLKFVPLSEAEIAAQRDANPFIVAQLALRELPKFVTAEETRTWGIPMTTFREFLRANEEWVRESYAGLK